MTIDKPADGLNVLRRAGSQKQRNVIYRNKRSYLMAENVKFKLAENDVRIFFHPFLFMHCSHFKKTNYLKTSANNFGTLEVSGYLQGLPLSVNGLIHIPGFGDYQMSHIEETKDPFPLGPEKVLLGTDVQMDGETRVLAVANPKEQVKKIYKFI